jgi:hypothetical protein
VKRVWYVSLRKSVPNSENLNLSRDFRTAANTPSDRLKAVKSGS